MDPLETFRQIYGQVPDWAEAMHRWAPEAGIPAWFTGYAYLRSAE
ncbi:hypothetical protein [Alicyclobacillus macrosporangiidus]|nr:hypothetical protein [Alicyclobacillus macrosporangiidus]